jgi:Protein of unknown function (DUF3987)
MITPMIVATPAQKAAAAPTEGAFLGFVDILAEETVTEESQPPFPTEMLPQPFRNFVEDIADGKQVPADFAAIPTLIGAATMIGNEFRMAPLRHDDWSERACLWGLIVASSGSMKTPSAEEALKPAKKVQTECMERWKKEHDAWKAQPEAERGPEPVAERLITNDATTEALARLMTDCGNADPRGLLLYRDELAGWYAGMNKYRAQGGDDRQFFLQCWSGGPSHSDRVRETHYVEDCYLNIFGTIQPRVIDKMFRDGEQDGLTARFGLAAYPKLPDRVDFVDRRPDIEARKAVAARLREMRATTACDEGESDGLFTGQGTPTIPRVLRFDGDAYVIFEEWSRHNRNRPEYRDDSSFGVHVAKYPALFARLALVLHFMKHGDKAGRFVSADTAFAVRRLVDLYLEPHARQLYGLIEAHPALPAAKKIAEWIRRKRIEKFTLRDVRKNEWKEFAKERDTDAITAALNLLEAKGWLRMTEKPSGVKGGRPTAQAIVNPVAFGG